jgi:ribosomal protein S18 acetylase RimI-like enzyme
MSSSPAEQVVRLMPEQNDLGAKVLTDAFMDDPMYKAIFPVPETRAKALNNVWNGLLKYSHKYGEVYTTPEVAGVACWLSPGNTTVTFLGQMRTGFALFRAVMKFSAQERTNFMNAMDFVDVEHKCLVQGPHWYLWALGVSPDYQGKGIGGRLLEPVLARADEEEVPCYLEAVTEPNVAFYKKRGFKVIWDGDTPIQGVHVWMMLRDPAI